MSSTSLPAMGSIKRSIGGFQILCTRSDPLIALLASRRAEGRATELMFANTNFVMTCHRMAGALHGPETLIVNDGIGLDCASWLLAGEPFPENLNGTDFTPRLLASLDRPTRLFLLGARPAAVRGAAAAWNRLPQVEVVGALDGYDDMADPEAAMRAIAAARPDLLLVALGDPRQAQWIVSHRGRHGVPLVIGVGALFDFVSGGVSRAPRLVRKLRLEWIYRLLQEPRRLAKRYSIDLVAFFAHCWRMERAERIAARRAS
jgi:beta-1,4-glucosyltransferase